MRLRRRHFYGTAPANRLLATGEAGAGGAKEGCESTPEGGSLKRFALRLLCDVEEIEHRRVDAREARAPFGPVSQLFYALFVGQIERDRLFDREADVARRELSLLREGAVQSADAALFAAAGGRLLRAREALLELVDPQHDGRHRLRHLNRAPDALFSRVRPREEAAQVEAHERELPVLRDRLRSERLAAALHAEEQE